MSQFLVVTRPELVTGFQLAGVEAYAAQDVETAQEMIETWMSKGEEVLLAIDDGLLEKMEPAFIRRLNAAEKIPYLAIPGGGPIEKEASRKYQIAEMIRRAIGFHITFKGVEETDSDQ